MDSNIKFEHVKSDDHYIILNKKDDVLGQLGFHKRWNRWVFYPSAVCIGDEWFDIGCLKVIVKKLDTLQRWDEIKSEGKSMGSE